MQNQSILILFDSAISVRLYFSGYSPTVVDLRFGKKDVGDIRFETEAEALEYGAAVAIKNYIANSEKSEIIWRWKGARIIAATKSLIDTKSCLVGSRLFDYCKSPSDWNSHKRDVISRGRDTQVMSCSCGNTNNFYLLETKWGSSLFGGLVISQVFVL